MRCSPPARFSPAHLSLAASFQRGWGSIYDALVEGQIDGQAVETLLAQHPLEGGEPIYAVDASVWARCDAETSPQRAFYHHPSRHSAGQPIVAGWAYHWIAQVSFAHDSWTAPRKVRRLKPADNSNQVAVEQIQDFTGVCNGCVVQLYTRLLFCESITSAETDS